MGFQRGMGCESLVAGCGGGSRLRVEQWGWCRSRILVLSVSCSSLVTSQRRWMKDIRWRSHTAVPEEKSGPISKILNHCPEPSYDAAVEGALDM